MCKSNNMIGEKKNIVVPHHLDSNPRSRDSKTKAQAIRPWRYLRSNLLILNYTTTRYDWMIFFSKQNRY